MSENASTRHPRAPKFPRPTTKVSRGHRRGFPFDWNYGRHLHLWVGLGDVAAQVQVRVWRFEFGFLFWRSYDA